MLSKVPEVTVGFWVAKALSTALGESTSDYLVHRLGPYAAVLIGALALLLGLGWQFSTRRYIAWIYWFAVVMVAISGTLAADVVHVGFGVPYLISTIFYALVLSIVFVLWYRAEGTLSIHSITTVRREAFYWATVLATFALGTATGDMTAGTLGWGYLSSGLFFALVLLIPAALYARTALSPVFLFWFAYVFTRPFGASFADWLGKDRHLGGLALGDGPVSGVLTLLILAAVAYLARGVQGARLDPAVIGQGE
ncbi:MAG: hypothetical protein QOF83_4199 [Solirubrobacteraceae bacterium]|nr:hypothetical protein [Solirubrobacteraceae bacterium]